MNIWLRRYRQSFVRRAAKLPKNGLRWSQNSNYSNRKQSSTYKGRKIEWLALCFSKKAISNVGKKRKVKVTENCVENTDFAYTATSRPGHMPRQLPARLSGIRYINTPCTVKDFRETLQAKEFNLLKWYAYNAIGQLHR